MFSVYILVKVLLLLAAASAQLFRSCPAKCAIAAVRRTNLSPSTGAASPAEWRSAEPEILVATRRAAGVVILCRFAALFDLCHFLALAFPSCPAPRAVATLGTLYVRPTRWATSVAEGSRSEPFEDGPCNPFAARLALCFGAKPAV